MFYVYLLQSEKDSSYYIGQTANVFDRLIRHNSRRVSSTRARAPWKLLGFEEYLTRNEARWREHQIKNSYTKKKSFIMQFSPHSSVDRARASGARDRGSTPREGTNVYGHVGPAAGGRDCRFD